MSHNNHSSAKEKRSTVICILGMHRSGTSCLAGSLEELGLYLGEVANASAFNLKGNKESVLLREINESVLAYSGGSWDNPPDQLCWNDELRNRRDSYIANQQTQTGWGFKDPRTILTLPFWFEANLNLQFVGTFRHPSAVINSLSKRKSLQPMLPALMLWKKYNILLLEYLAKSQFPLICFDKPANEYLSDIRILAETLMLPTPKDQPLNFFEAQLKTSCSAFDIPLDEESIQIYNKLLTLAVNSKNLTQNPERQIV